jgi:hypothetical protein
MRRRSILGDDAETNLVMLCGGMPQILHRSASRLRTGVTLFPDETSEPSTSSTLPNRCRRAGSSDFQISTEKPVLEQMGE